MRLVVLGLSLPFAFAAGLIGCQVVFSFEEVTTLPVEISSDAGEAALDESQNPPIKKQADASPETTPPMSIGTDAGVDMTSENIEQAPCAGLAHPDTRGTLMLAVPRLDASCFWMDTHEVTREQYRRFAESQPPGLSLPCSWNTEYYDTTCEDASLRITSEPLHPQVCVDQCDAEEYCLSVGKTLCRSSVTGIAKRDDWSAACSNAGEDNFPYGNSVQEQACNVLARGAETTTSVRTNSACSNDAGVRDLVGNVAEWTGGDDACLTHAGADDSCLIRGGSFIDALQNADCTSSKNPQRSATFDHVGFRCCNYSQ